jgi:hypothetical protein
MLGETESIQYFSKDRPFSKLFSSYANMNYYNNLWASSMNRSFYHFLQHKLPKIQSDTKQKVTLIIQTGSWDIASWPLQQYILHNASAQSFLNLVQSLKTSEYSEIIDLIWLQNMPIVSDYFFLRDYTNNNFFLNITANDTAFDNQQSWRNNYAVMAMNQYTEQQLRLINYPRMKYIPAFDIVYARRNVEIPLCGSHWLCREDRTDVQTTHSGELLVEVMLKSACDHY